MIVLHHSPFSTCSQKVRLALAEKQVAWSSREIDFTRQEHLSSEYLRLNPNGVVPTLVHDGTPIVDSSVICEYLDEVFPQPPLAPADPRARATMRSWMRYLEEVPTAAIRVPSFNKLFAAHLATMPRAEFEAMTAKMPIRKQFYRQMGPAGFDQRVYDESIEKLCRTLHRVNEALSAGPWLGGYAYSIADIVLTPIVIRMADLELSSMWKELPNVSAWLTRVQARDSFQKAFGPGSRLAPGSFRPLVPVSMKGASV